MATRSATNCCLYAAQGLGVLQPEPERDVTPRIWYTDQVARDGGCTGQLNMTTRDAITELLATLRRHREDPGSHLGGSRGHGADGGLGRPLRPEYEQEWNNVRLTTGPFGAFLLAVVTLALAKQW